MAFKVFATIILSFPECFTPYVVLIKIIKEQANAVMAIFDLSPIKQSANRTVGYCKSAELIARLFCASSQAETIFDLWVDLCIIFALV